MLYIYRRELKDKVRKELVELLEYDPAHPGSLQAIAKRHSIPITTVYGWNSGLKRTAGSLGTAKGDCRSSEWPSSMQLWQQLT